MKEVVRMDKLVKDTENTSMKNVMGTHLSSAEGRKGCNLEGERGVITERHE